VVLAEPTDWYGSGRGISGITTTAAETQNSPTLPTKREVSPELLHDDASPRTTSLDYGEFYVSTRTFLEGRAANPCEGIKHKKTLEAFASKVA
jgi:hypothetical protein